MPRKTSSSASPRRHRPPRTDPLQRHHHPRAVWGASLDLGEITEITDAFSVTVNDVFLAVIIGGPRRYV